MWGTPANRTCSALCAPTQRAVTGQIHAIVSRIWLKSFSSGRLRIGSWCAMRFLSFRTLSAVRGPRFAAMPVSGKLRITGHAISLHIWVRTAQSRNRKKAVRLSCTAQSAFRPCGGTAAPARVAGAAPGKAFSPSYHCVLLQAAVITVCSGSARQSPAPEVHHENSQRASCFAHRVEML